MKFVAHLSLVFCQTSPDFVLGSHSVLKLKGSDSECYVDVTLDSLTQDNRLLVSKLPFIYATSDKPFEITPCIPKF